MRTKKRAHKNDKRATTTTASVSFGVYDAHGRSVCVRACYMCCYIWRSVHSNHTHTHTQTLQRGFDILTWNVLCGLKCKWQERFDENTVGIPFTSFIERLRDEQHWPKLVLRKRRRWTPISCTPMLNNNSPTPLVGRTIADQPVNSSISAHLAALNNAAVQWFTPICMHIEAASTAQNARHIFVCARRSVWAPFSISIAF